MRRLLKIKPIFFVCLLSFASAFWVNQLNLKHIPTELKRENQTVKTNDDASYLVPPVNYIETGEWKDNSIGKQSYFVRPPGYGIIYMIFTKLSDTIKALSLLKWFQLILFSVSVFWLFYITKQLFNSNKAPYIVSFIYGLLPFTSGFLFYTLTEGVTPSLLLYYIYLLFKAEQTNIVNTKRVYYLAAAVCFAFLLLVRPALGLFGLLIPAFILRDYSRKGVGKALTRAIVFSVLAFSLTIAWQVRNFSIAKSYVGVHSIYYEDANSIYRPSFKAYWDFPLGIGQQGHEVHAYMVPMWQAAINGDTSITYVNKAIVSFPTKIVDYFGKERLTKVFRKYQEATLLQKTYYDQELPMPIEISEVEQESINEFEKLTDDLKSKFWIDYYFVSPAKVFKTMAFHSNLSHYIFQHTFRGNTIVEALRYLCFGIHSLCFVLLIMSLFFINKIDWRLATINFIAFAYVLYLCFIQRGIEERYTLPILALLLIVALSTLKEMFRLLRR